MGLQRAVQHFGETPTGHLRYVDSILVASGSRFKMPLPDAYLAAATFDRPVVVLFHKRDRYGRLVGKVLVDDRDAGLAMLNAGLAWHYLAFAKEQSSSNRRAYAQAEQAARLARRGLWVQAQPLPPWEFRHARRH